MSELLSKRMSKGMETDPGSPEILQELIDVSVHPQFLTTIKQLQASNQIVWTNHMDDLLTLIFSICLGRR